MVTWKRVLAGLLGLVLVGAAVLIVMWFEWAHDVSDVSAIEEFESARDNGAVNTSFEPVELDSPDDSRSVDPEFPTLGSESFRRWRADRSTVSVTATAYDYGSRSAALRAWIWNSPQWVWPAESDRYVATGDAEDQLPDDTQLVGYMCEDGACSEWVLWCRVGHGIWKIDAQVIHIPPAPRPELDLTVAEFVAFVFPDGVED